MRESLYTPSYYLGWHQCWTGIIFICYHLSIFNEDFTFFDTSRVWVLDGIFVVNTYHLPCSQIVEIVFPTFIDGCGRAKGSSNWSHGSAPAAPTPSAYRATSLPTTHITFQVLWPYCLGNFHLQIFWAISLVHWELSHSISDCDESQRSIVISKFMKIWVSQDEQVMSLGQSYDSVTLQVITETLPIVMVTIEPRVVCIFGFMVQSSTVRRVVLMSNFLNYQPCHIPLKYKVSNW